MPEARVVGHEAVVRGIHEKVQRDTVAVRIQGQSADFPNLYVAKIRGRADTERADIVRMQGVVLSLHRIGNDRRGLEPDELAGYFRAVAEIHADVRAGKERSQTGDTACPESRPHDPESRAAHEQGFGELLHVDRQVHRVVVGRERNFADQAGIDALVSDLRLPGLDAFGIGKRDADGGPAIEDCVHSDPAANQRRHERHDPDQRESPALASRLRRYCQRHVAHFRRRLVLSHDEGVPDGLRRCPAASPDPTSAVGRTLAPRT